MEHPIEKMPTEDLPDLMKEMEDPPRSAYTRGTMPHKENTFLCVVGSRKVSSYGKEACSKIIKGLAGYSVVIVSGLALGIDAEAHKRAMEARLKTVAIPGSGLNDSVIYPKSHLSLAKEILNSGGALFSEFEPDFEATNWSFPKRNRVMAGMSHGILVIEAEKRSGTLITARAGLEYNREIFAVPGSIFSSTSEGTNYLIKQGAYPVTSAKDIIDFFSLSKKETKGEIDNNLSEDEVSLINKLKEPMRKNDLIASSKLPTAKANILISSLEIKGYIKESDGILYPFKE
ncbi:MAG: DNA-processing protein DprA [Patescibacteria group bacterium]